MYRGLILKERQQLILLVLQHLLGILHCREEENGGSGWFYLFSNTYWVFSTAERKKMEAVVDFTCSATPIGYSPLQRGRKWRQLVLLVLQHLLGIHHCWEEENGVLVLHPLLGILHCWEEENGGSRWHHFPANKIQKVSYILQSKIRDLRVQNFKAACKEMGFLSFDAVLIMTGPLRKI